MHCAEGATVLASAAHAAYLLITFSNKHADASSVLAYTALQPLTTALLSWLLDFIPAMKHFHLAQPGINSLGGLAVLLGYFVLRRREQPHLPGRAQAAADGLRDGLRRLRRAVQPSGKPDALVRDGPTQAA